MSAQNTTPSAARKSSTTPSASSLAQTTRSPSRQESPAAPAANGITRNRTQKSSTGSPLSARGTVKKPGAAAAKDTTQIASDDDARAEQAVMIDDLRSQARKAEAACEEYQKELAVLQSKLDEALGEQAKLEESTNQYADKLQALQAESAETLKQKKDIEAQYEKEQAAISREREEAVAREEEMKTTITRMKESLVQREVRKSVDGEGLGRQTSLRGRRSPNPEATSGEAAARRDSSQSSSRLILQKDKVIENLRLELAEAQIKLVEVENAGGGRFQELEKTLLETRMANAKLMEDNESFQFLLQEKTLNGELSKGVFQTESAALEKSAKRGSSLADELETVDEADQDSDNIRKLEAELGAQKEQNKALTLYINRIITKLLQTDKFEALFEEGSVTGDNPLNKGANAQKDKDLPATPSQDSQKENAAPSLLQRATSVFGRGKARPTSYVPPPATSGPSVTQSPAHSRHSSTEAARLHEDPATAPSIPIAQPTSNLTARPHRRSKSEWATASSILNKPGPTSNPDVDGTPKSSRSPSYSGQRLSPPSTGPNSPPNRHAALRSSFSSSNAPPLILEDNTADGATAAAADGHDLSLAPTEADSVAGSSPSDARSLSTAASTSAAGAIGGFFGAGLGRSMSSAGNKMRPLRLVQEKEADDAEKRRANRQSWVGWFQRGTGAAQTPQQDQPGTSMSEARPGSGGS